MTASRMEGQPFRVPTEVAEIGEEAFRNSLELYGVTFPEGLRIINAAAFDDCLFLSELEFPESLKYIGLGAFASRDSFHL